MKQGRILIIALSSLLLVIMLVGCAEYKSVFPDKNLEVVIRDAIGKSAGEEITIDELANLTKLEAKEMGISDLTGLEYCVNLSSLNLGFNNISDISPLVGLTKLEWLLLSENNINDISPLAGLTNLQGLHLNQNNISDISPLASLTSLIQLYLNENEINNISPLVENNGLLAVKYVNLSGNPLDTTSARVYIPQLEARGVNVIY